MHTHFKNLVITFLMLMASVAANAQNTINISVLPPYTNRVADYSNSPNKVMVIVTINPAATPNFSGKIFFQGKLKNASGDIEIATPSGFRPAMPITLPVMAPGMPITYTVPFAEIQNLFNWNILEYKGISREQVVQYGMPEDLYTFCLKTYDFETLEVLIEETCSPIINMAMLEPPVVISPMSNSKIMQTPAQNVLFNWTIPPGAPPTTRYTLRIVELSEGLNPNDALRSSNYPMKFFETTVTGTNYLLTSAGPKLEPGKEYAFVVIASDAVTRSAFRNDGVSEIHTIKIDLPLEDENSRKIEPQQLVFISPATQDSLALINDETAFPLFWNWRGLLSSLRPGEEFTQVMLDSLCTKMGVERFMLTFSHGQASAGRYALRTPSFSIGRPNADSHLPHYFFISQERARDIGFIEGNWYKATINALNQRGEIVSSAASVDFKYSYLPLPPKQPVVNLLGSLEYGFKNKPGRYIAPNTPITIEAEFIERTPEAALPDKGITSFADGLSNRNQTTGLPSGIYQRPVFRTTTDNAGKFNLYATLNAQPGDSILFRVKSNNPYYLDQPFDAIGLRIQRDSSTVNFGQLWAETYGYSLKLNVEQRFADAAGIVDMPEGLDVKLYRKEKRSEIPPIEGDIEPQVSGVFSVKPVDNGLVEVASGKTQVEILAGGKRNTFVQFERLLSAANAATDMYYIRAFAPSGGQFTLASWGNDFIAEEMPFLLSMPAAFHEDSLYRNATATYQLISKRPPSSTVKGRLVYTWKSDPNGVVRPIANTNIRIIEDWLVNGELIEIGSGTFSTGEQVFPVGRVKVPIASVTVGTGKTDANGEFEISFKNDKTINQFNGTYVPDNMPNGYIQENLTMPVWQREIGKNLDGVYNVKDWYNQYISDPKDAIINPGIFVPDYSVDFASQSSFFDFYDWGVQSNMNQGHNVTPGEDGSYNVNSNAGTNPVGFAPTPTENTDRMFLAEADNRRGPNASAEPQNPVTGVTPQNPVTGASSQNTNNLSQNPNIGLDSFIPGNGPDRLKRVYRVVMGEDEYYPSSMFYYPSANTFSVKPLETYEFVEPQKHYVTETTVQVTCVDPNEESKKLKLVTAVFRGSNKPLGGLPLGEGDGAYIIRKLMNPQLNDTNASGDLPTIGGDVSQLFNTEFEHIWDRKQLNDGTVAFSGLLTYHNDYYIEACSESDQGSDYYEAAFAHITSASMKTADMFDPDVWKGIKDPPVVQMTIRMKPLPSRIYARVLDVAGMEERAVKNAHVHVNSDHIILPGSNNQTPTIVTAVGSTDSNGYVEMTFDQYPLNKFRGYNGDFTLHAHALKTGYSPSDLYHYTFNSSKGQQWTPKILLTPGGTLSIKVYEMYKPDEGIEAYIAVNSTVVDTTDMNGIKNNIRVPNVAGTQIVVIPRDPAYFNDTITIAAKQDSYTFDAPLLRKQHKIHFFIKDSETGQPIEGALISLGDSVATVTRSGDYMFTFENVSVNNYTFVIRGPADSDYIPVTKIVRSEESKDAQICEVSLNKGSRISGAVTLNGQTVKNAKVYLEASSQTSAVSINTPFTTSSSTTTIPSTVLTGFSGGTGNSGNTDDQNLIVAYTDANGYYILRGVPFKNGSNVKVMATLDTTFTVIGSSQEVSVVANTTGVNFDLKRYDDMRISNLYGFPLTIESLARQDDGTAKVTGLVNWGAGISVFKAIDAYQQLRVEDVTFQPKTMPDGRIVGEAVETSVPLKGVTGIKLGYLDGKYNVQLQVNRYTELKISRESDGRGSISGKMNIIDNSFNFTESYLSFKDSASLYFATKEGATMNTTIRTIISPLTEPETNAVTTSLLSNEPSSGGLDIASLVSPSIASNLSSAYRNQITQNQSLFSDLFKPFYLTDSKGDSISFTLLGFNAKANPKESHIDVQGRIRLKDVNASCHIPNAKPENLTFRIPDLVIDNHGILPANGSNLEIGLGGSGGWTLIADEWEMSTQEGGILSRNAKIRTNVMDIPLKTLTLRPDMFLMLTHDKIEGLTMGGGAANVELSDDAKGVVQWDNAVGDDHGGHWKFTLTGKEGKPAAKAKLSYLYTATGDVAELQIIYLQILDNNSMSFQLKPPSPQDPLYVHGNRLAKFTPTSVYNGPTSIDVIGSLNIGAPRSGEMRLTLNYSKPGNAQVMTPSNVVLDFITKGFVHFLADRQASPNIIIDQNTIQIFGQVYENPKTFNNMPAILVADASGYRIDIPNTWITQLSQDTDSVKWTNVANKVHSAPVINNSEGFSVKIAKGGTKVTGNDWEIFTFEGILKDNNTNNQNGFRPTPAKFTVYGDIVANFDSVGVNNINILDIATVNIIFDIKKMRLIGDFETEVPIEIPIISPLHLTVKELRVQFLADKGGFCISAAATGHIKPVPEFMAKSNLGFMIGYYRNETVLRNEIWPVVNTYITADMKNQCYLDFICGKGGLAGVFFTFQEEILDLNLEVDVLIADVIIHLQSAIRGDVYMNFVDQKKAAFDSGLSLLYKSKLRAYASIVGGLASVDGTMNDLLMAEISLSNNNPNIFNAQARFQRIFDVKVKALWGLAEKDFRLFFLIDADTDQIKGTSQIIPDVEPFNDERGIGVEAFYQGIYLEVGATDNPKSVNEACILTNK